MINLETLEPVSARRLTTKPGQLPRESGVYLWLFDPGEQILQRAGYYRFDTRKPASVADLELLYVGATGGALRDRILAHLTGNTRSSSLRMTLGPILASELHLEPVGEGSRSYYEFGDGEVRLTEWIAEHTSVAWVTSDQPFVAEKELLRSLAVPLNISERKTHRFSKYLMALRACYASRSVVAGTLLREPPQNEKPRQLTERVGVFTRLWGALVGVV